MDTSRAAVIEAVPTRKAASSSKRQHRSPERKRKIVEETLLPGASVARVARAHGVNANQVFQWRRLYHAGRLGGPPLPHSDDCFVAAYPAETTEAFCDAHVRAFEYFGGVPRFLVYDNTKLAVAKILGGGERKKTRAFIELQSHYLFAERFGRPGKGNDKGAAEGLVGYARRNFLVPVPHCSSWEELNAHLLEQCRKRREQKVWGETETIGERFERDRAVLLPLPPTPYEACEKHTGKVSSLSLVRYRANDYSVPTEYRHRPVLVKGYVDAVVIACASEVIARHPRSYEREDIIFEPRHYLALLEQKTGALDQAAPLQGWKLPECFAQLRRLLEARLGKPGKREYVQVLRLLETFSVEEVRGAIEDALHLGTISFDAVKHLVLCRIERRPPRMNLIEYPHLPLPQVATTQAADYLALLASPPPSANVPARASAEVNR